MAMMDDSSWNTQNQSLPPGNDEDFHQFLDMGGMGGMSDSIQFDFQDFAASNGNAMLQQNPREQLDTQMGGTDALAMAGQAQHVPQSQHQQLSMTTAVAHPSIPAHQMIPMPQPTDPIGDIDAQIQFLQQQRLQHQQRQIQEQQVQQQVQQQAQQHAVFYARQNQVPPTPQSLEMPPNSGHFYSQDQHQQNVFESRYQRMKDQQDVRRFFISVSSIPVANSPDRWLSLR